MCFLARPRFFSGGLIGLLFMAVIFGGLFGFIFSAHAAEPIVINTITRVGGSAGNFNGLGLSISSAAFQFGSDKQYSLSAFEMSYCCGALRWTLRNSLDGAPLGTTNAQITGASGLPRFEFTTPLTLNAGIVYYLETEGGFAGNSLQRVPGSGGNWALGNQVYGFRDDNSSWMPLSPSLANYVSGGGDITFYGELLTKVFVDSLQEIDPATDNFLHEGASLSKDSVRFQAMASTTLGTSIKLQAEVRATNEPFSGTNDGHIYESIFASSPGILAVTISSLPNGAYHARLRAVDDLGNASDWQEFGTTGNTDFTINFVANTTSALINTFNPSGSYGTFTGLGYSPSSAAYAFTPDKDYTLTRFEMEYLDGLYWTIRKGLDGEIMATSSATIAVPDIRKKWEFFGGANLTHGTTYYLQTSSGFNPASLLRVSGSGTAWAPGGNVYGRDESLNWNTYGNSISPQNFLAGNGNNHEVYFYGFSSTAIAKNPVIVVPGIMGSQLSENNNLAWLDLTRMFFDINDNFLNESLSLDQNGNSIKTVIIGNTIKNVLNVPVLGIHTFDHLEESLRSNGYTDANLFFFPYDWRLNLDITKDLLNQKIEEIKTVTGASKVDIVAHSMGGLLVEDYINQYGKNSIGKLIFVGTPHLGSPKSARTLLEGDNLGIPWLDNDAVKDVAHNSPAIYELLPTQTYVNNLSGYIKPWSLLGSNPYTYNETKSFLLNQGMNVTVLNQAESFFSKNLQNTDFSGVDTYNIAGCNTGTESLYQLHVLNNGIGLIGYKSGDGTVPLGSADFVNLPVGKKYYVKNVDHSSLPSAEDVRAAIVNILSDSSVATSSSFKADSSVCGINGKVLTWHSPVEVHVYDAQNHHTGPIENNAIEYGIHGVQYQILGHNKFIFLPTDTSEDYRIEAKGTDSGTFDLLIAENNNGMIVDTNVFNDIPVATSTDIIFSVSSITPDNAISVQSGSSTPTIVPATSLLLGSQGEDVVAPVTTASTSDSIRTNGWYKSDVKVVLRATDDNSGILETRYSLNDGLTFLPYTAPINITQEGTTTLKYFSIDKAGNDEDIKTLTVKIDKTPPEFTVYFDTSGKLYKFEATDNLSSGLIALCTNVKCTATDGAGNTTILTYEKSIILNQNILTLKTISYNEVIAKLPENILVVNFDSKNGLVKSFNQTLLVRKQEVMRIEYDTKNDKSTIYSLTKTGGISKQIVTGRKILQAGTNNGKIETRVK